MPVLGGGGVPGGIFMHASEHISCCPRTRATRIYA